MLAAYSSNMVKHLRRVLHVLRYFRILSRVSNANKLKGTVFRKVKWGIINWPAKEHCKFIFGLINNLCVYEEDAKLRKGY